MKGLLPLFLLAAAAPVRAPAGTPADREILFGTYVDTIRNRDTHGGTVACRRWFLPANPGDGFDVLHPRPFYWGIEGRAGFLVDPEPGGEGAVLLDLGYGLPLLRRWGLEFFAGCGASYCGVRYSNTTYWNVVTRAGAALRFDAFLLQGAYEHRSNAGLGRYNRGVDLITAAVGVRF